MDSQTHAFIIRIWDEKTDEEGRKVIWRGAIDHVSSQKRLYFQNMEGIIHFIEEQAQIQPMQPPPWWRFVFNWMSDQWEKIPLSRKATDLLKQK